MVGERGAARPLSETGTQNPPREARKGEHIWVLDGFGGADTMDTQEETSMFQTLTHIIRSIQTTMAITLGGARLQPLRIETRRTRRAATFIEYALLAGVAVAVTFLLRNQLLTLVERVVSGVTGGFEQNK